MFEFLFGKKCIKIPRSKRDKRKKCKGKKKCAVRSRRRSDLRKKCTSPRRISKKVKARGGSATEQAEAAAAVAAQAAETRGASPAEVVEVATQTALETARNSGASPMEVREAVRVAIENAGGAFDYDSASEYDDILAFGQRSSFCSKCGYRGTRFGSECSVLPKTPGGCTQHSVNGRFPCYLTKSGCRKRTDKQSRQLIYVVRNTRSRAVREVLQEELKPRVVVNKRVPVSSPNEYLPIIDELDFGKSGFGKRRKKSNRKVILRMCKKYKIRCTKKVGKHRVYRSVQVLKRELAKKMK